MSYRCIKKCQWNGRIWGVGETIDVLPGGKTPPTTFFETVGHSAEVRAEADTPDEREKDLKDREEALDERERNLDKREEELAKIAKRGGKGKKEAEGEDDGLGGSE